VRVRDSEKRFIDYLDHQKLKYTSQRRTILHEALKASAHFTADQLLDLSKKKDKRISKATLYRTLMLLKESRVLEEQDFGRGYKSYERLRPHHDHLICVKCGRILEFQNPRIESLQSEEAKRRGFQIVFHSHKLFGICSKCR